MSDEHLRDLERHAAAGDPAEVEHGLVALLRSGQRARATELLLTLWRRSRDPVVAGFVDELSDPLPPVLEHLDDATRPEDPRVALALARAVLDLTAELIRADWKRVFELVAKHGDARTLFFLEEAERRFWRVVSPPRSRDALAFHDGLLGARDAVYAAVAPFAARKRDVALLRAIRAALRPLGLGTRCGICDSLPRSMRFDDDWQALCRVYCWLRPRSRRPTYGMCDQELRCPGCRAFYRVRYSELLVTPEEPAPGPETERTWIVERA